MALSQFSFLNRKDAAYFLRIMLRELRALSLREGFSDVRKAIDVALQELRKVEIAPVIEEPAKK